VILGSEPCPNPGPLPFQFNLRNELKLLKAQPDTMATGAVPGACVHVRSKRTMNRNHSTYKQHNKGRPGDGSRSLSNLLSRHRFRSCPPSDKGHTRCVSAPRTFWPARSLGFLSDHEQRLCPGFVNERLECSGACRFVRYDRNRWGFYLPQSRPKLGRHREIRPGKGKEVKGKTN
jgi:hypothetical protein